MISFFCFACSNNYYNVPRESFEKKVKILGVMPIFLDPESDIRHPEKEALANLIKEQNRKNEKELVALLKETGAFFSVRFLDGDPDSQFGNLLLRRELRDDASVVYNKYFYSLPELKEAVTKNGVDAIMFTVVSGITREDTVRSGNLISYLKSNYNCLVMTSQIYDADGNILWEYPNFREYRPELSSLIELQYPAFDEAAANSTDYVDIKFKSIPGITRAFDKTEDSSLPGGGKVSKLYLSIFNDMVDLLKPEKELPWSDKKEDRSNEPKQQEPPTADYIKPIPVNSEPTGPNAVQSEVIKEEPVVSQPIKEELIKEESIK
jgi:hypothetical protein